MAQPGKIVEIMIGAKQQKHKCMYGEFGILAMLPKVRYVKPIGTGNGRIPLGT
jgi:hypothetical protein